MDPIDQAVKRRDREGTLAVAAEIVRLVPPADVLPRLGEFLDRLFVEQKDLDALSIVALLGIGYGMAHSRAESHGEPSKGALFARQTHQIATNLALYLWPGRQNERLVTWEAHHLRLGRQAARLSLRLARELDAGPLETARALWLAGVHEMSEGHTRQASERFTAAEEMARAAGAADTALLYAAYRVLTRWLRAPDDVGLQDELDLVLGDLAFLENGEEYLAEIENVQAVFSRPGPWR